MHNYQACTLEPRNYNPGSTCHSCLSLGALEPALCSKRSHHKEKPRSLQQEKSQHSNEVPAQPKPIHLLTNYNK